MSWQDQGRQQHGWFGSGTSSNGEESPSDASLDQRLDAVIYGSVAAMPPALRGEAGARLDSKTHARLNGLMATWSRGGNMDRAEFAGQFFGRAGDDRVSMALRDAALTARLSGSQAALRDAAESLASAMQTIGLVRLSRFLDDAETRARSPSTLAALEKSSQTLEQRGGAIRPVYPLETALGIGAALATGGVAAAVRAAVGAVARQLLPERAPVMNEPSATATPNKPGKDAIRPSPNERTPTQEGGARVRLSPERRTHILDGEPGGGGGHRYGTGKSGKSEFPASWSDKKIIDEIESVANDPASTRYVQLNRLTRLDRSRDGVDIRVILNPDGISVRTAFPTNMPINP